MNFIFKMIIIALTFGLLMSACNNAATFKNKTNFENTPVNSGNNFKNNYKDNGKTNSVSLLPKSAFSTLTAVEWMATSSMPQVMDKPLSASEAAYILRKIGFEPSPSEVSQWIGQNRSILIAKFNCRT